MIYLCSNWDTHEFEDLKGGCQIVSQGRTKAPIYLMYAFNPEKLIWYYEISEFPKLTLSDLAERPTAITRARSNQRALELINVDLRGNTADFLADLSRGDQASGDDAKILFKGSHGGTKSEEFMRKFLQETVLEIKRQPLWLRKTNA